MKFIKSPLPLPASVKWYDKIWMAVAFILAFFFLSHPDLWETANHSYIFLENLFDGNFFNFYEVVAAHENTYYYINGAHYNILAYALFGLWELPVFLFHRLFDLALNENFLIYWAKLLSAGFFVGCGFMVQKLCLALSMKAEDAKAAGLFFVFNPIAFFAPMAMGQYDTLCLLFTLWALVFYVQKRYTAFSLVLGVGVVFKFFPLLIFVPLILLVEKRIWNLLKYALCALWLYVPTTLLFLGRTGNASVFTQQMIDRMFALTGEMGMREVSLFTLAYAVLVFWAFLYHPRQEKAMAYYTVYVPLLVFGLLFISIYWHPQWLVLLIPFVVITTFLQKNQSPWFWLDIVLCAGFFLLCYYHYPSQMGAILLDGGLVNHLFGQRVALQSEWLCMDYFLSFIPYVYVLTPVCFVGAIGANIIFKMPMGGTTLGDKLSANAVYDKIPRKAFAYLIFIIGFVCVWAAPMVLEACNAFGLL